jgi:hypothetical protein
MLAFELLSSISEFKEIPLDEQWDEPHQVHRQRFLRIGDALINALEQLERLQHEPDQPLVNRITSYRLHGLAKAESHFGLKAAGDLAGTLSSH